mgnify:CR=1 FL=1
MKKIDNYRGRKILSPYRIVTHQIHDEKYKRLDHRMTCAICGREYWSHKCGKFWVQTCQSCDLYVICANKECKKENLVTDHPSRVLENIKNGNISCCDLICSSKAREQQQKRKLCPVCGKNNFNIMGLCMTCHNKEINSSIICPIHGFQENSFGGKCIKCINENQYDRLVKLAVKNCNKLNDGYWKTEEGKEKKSKNFKENCKISIKYCKNCNCETKHRGNKCLICHPEANGNGSPIFTIKENVKTYKNIPVDYLSKIILKDNNELKKYPELEIRNGYVCFHFRDIITDNFIGDIKNFRLSNNSEIFYKGKNLTYILKNLENKIYKKKDYPEFYKKYCDICKKETWYYNDICLNCEINYNNTKKLDKNNECNYYNNNFSFKNKVKYYKGEPIEFVISKLDSGEYNIKDNCIGFNKRYCKNCKSEVWHCGAECIVCGNINKLNNGGIPNFIEIDNVLYYYDKDAKKYIPWKNYKDKIENKKEIPNSIKEFQNLIQQNYLNNDIFIQQTFRTQESKNWSGAKAAFEMSLAEKNIVWFVYIKFYRKINDANYIKPLVAGKSGSLLVNKSGSDVNFSENVEDGPARRLLSESNGKYVWDKTKILVVSCKSEEEALKIESEIQKKYNLFGS